MAAERRQGVNTWRPDEILVHDGVRRKTMPCDREKKDYEQAVEKRMALRAEADRVTKQWEKSGYKDENLLREIYSLAKEVKRLEEDEQAKRLKLIDCIKVN